MLNISNVSKIQSGETLYSGATFQVNPGEKEYEVSKGEVRVYLGNYDYYQSKVM